MKKFLLLLFIALPIWANAQVANPEKTKSLTTRTGWTATSGSEQMSGEAAPSGPVTAVLDGDNNSFWSSIWGSTIVPETHYVQIDMQASQNIDGIYVVQRNHQNSSIHTIALIETSTDGVAWTSQATSVALVSPTINNSYQYISFPSTVNCRYYRIVLEKNYLLGTETGTDQTITMAETGAFTYVIPDNTSWDRSDWIITATDKNGNPDSYSTRPTSNLKDGDAGTWWEADWSKGAGFFPRTLKLDFGSALSINKFSYIQRNHTNSRIKTAIFSYSADDISYTTIPVTWQTNSNVNSILIGSTTNVRYVKIEIAESVGDVASVALAEFRAHFDQTLPVNLTSFTAKTKGSSVNLNWATASEKDASHFNVTRSKDGSNFTTIGKVDAAGNSNTAKNYSFTDNAPYAGVNYYQLQQVDYNGDINTSGITSAKVALSSAELVVKEITANEIVVALQGITASNGTITTVNAQGQKIASQAADLANGNTITVKTAAKGLIILTLTTAEGSISKKIIK